jgi:hypothetical protein
MRFSEAQARDRTELGDDYAKSVSKSDSFSLNPNPPANQAPGHGPAFTRRQFALL